MDKLFDDEDLLINPPETKVKSLTKQKSFEVCTVKTHVYVYVYVYVIAYKKNSTKHSKMLEYKKGS